MKIVDLSWVKYCAKGLYKSLEANLYLFDSVYNIIIIEKNAAGLLEKIRFSRVYIITGPIDRELQIFYITRKYKISEYINWIPRIPLVVMLANYSKIIFVHDINILDRRVYDGWRRPNIYSRLHFLLSLRQSNFRYTFSSYVSRILITKFKLSSEICLQKIYCPTFSEGERGGYDVVIFMDNRPYKGAWISSRLFSKSKKIKCAIFGTASEDQINIMRHNGIDVTILQPTDMLKFQLLAKAKLIIFCSKHEGFGIPPREAGFFGVPSLVVRRAALFDIPKIISLNLANYGMNVDLDQVLVDSLSINKEALRAWAMNYLSDADFELSE